MLGDSILGNFYLGQAHCNFHYVIRLSYLVVSSLVLQIIWNHQVKNLKLLQVSKSFNTPEFHCNTDYRLQKATAHWQLYKAGVLIITDY